MVEEMQQEIAALKSDKQFEQLRDDARKLAAFSRGDFKPIYDLPKVYAFLGYDSSTIPKAQVGAHADGGRCKICVYLGHTQVVDYNSASGGASKLPAGTVFNHNPWKCGFCKTAVEKRALELGSSAAEVAEVLKPLVAPPWKA